MPIAESRKLKKKTLFCILTFQLGCDLSRTIIETQIRGPYRNDLSMYAKQNLRLCSGLSGNGFRQWVLGKAWPWVLKNILTLFALCLLPRHIT